MYLDFKNLSQKNLVNKSNKLIKSIKNVERQ